MINQVRQEVAHLLSEREFQLIADWADGWDIYDDQQLVELVELIISRPGYLNGIPGFIYTSQIDRLFNDNKENIIDTLQQLEEYGLDIAQECKEAVLNWDFSKLAAMAFEQQMNEIACRLEHQFGENITTKLYEELEELEDEKE